jgi:antagonist of KipI
MTIRVVRPGALTTVQDLGRWGWQRYGMVVGGAMDRRALQVANLLVGNRESHAGLEMTLVGPKLHFEQESLIAICGGEMTVSGTSTTGVARRFLIPTARPVYLPANTQVDFGVVVGGCRSYLAVAGGFDVPVILESRSTYVPGAMGGYEGRALQTGDTLELGAIAPSAQHAIDRLGASTSNALPASTDWHTAKPIDLDPIVVRILPGSEFAHLSNDCQAELFQAEFKVTAKSDRMGYRLSGPDIRCDCPELISEGVTMGTIQLPPDGQLIVLMADGATTGGYPKIAHVAAVDLPRLAQAKPGAKIRFQKISLHTAHDLYRAADADMNRLRMGIKLKFC